MNTELIDLYWKIGEYISKKVQAAEWGHSIVDRLAEYLQHNDPDLKGFSNKNLWRMKQFYESYKDSPKLSTPLREVSWSHNLSIFSRCKTIEEREFYLKLAKNENCSFRELERQITAGVFERTMIGNLKVSTALRETYPEINSFKDSYVFEFLNLSEPHSEVNYKKG